MYVNPFFSHLPQTFTIEPVSSFKLFLRGLADCLSRIVI